MTRHAPASSPTDILVIGAGPAGASAATMLARAGRRVRLVDRARFPRDKVCGCCLAPGGVEALRDLGLDAVVASGLPLSTVTLGTPGGRLDLPFGGSIALGRDRLDAAIVDAARAAGAEVTFETAATVQVDGTAELSNANDGVTSRLTPSAILVADGLAGGTLDRHPRFARLIRRGGRFGTGVVLDAADDSPPAGRLLMLADRVGYLGVVRLPDGRIDLAAAFRSPAVRDLGGPGAAAAALLREHDRPRLAKAAEGARWRGMPGLTRRRRTVAHGTIACIGDAAAYVEPFTGEGMTWALRSGIESAVFVDAALTAGRSLDDWNRTHRRLVGAAHRRCRLVARALNHPEVVRRSAAMIATLPIGRAALTRVVTGGAPAAIGPVAMPGASA